jgi:ABC-type Fe3+-hydroxamate transport system substrate-binding protein|tara:strand:+ start:428 stop:916 length:489 start_codon:yes stop_codon:yes gene_type:complete
MKSTLNTAAIAAALLAVTGCSTVTTGTTQTVTLDTPMAAGAKCTMTDMQKRVYQVPATPASLVVEKGDGPMTIVCEKDGYGKTTALIDEEFAGATLGNILIGGGIGILIDAASGAAQRYPDKLTVWMKPQTFTSSEHEKQWNEAKLEWDKAEKARNTPPDPQ